MSATPTTDQFGNTGFFINSDTGAVCSPSNGTYASNCYFSTDVRSGGPKTDQFGNTIGGSLPEVGSDSNLNLLDEFDNRNNGFVSDVGVVDNVTIATTSSTSDDYFSEQALQISSGLTRTIQRDNQETGVKGIVEQSALSDYYFSDENTKVIQDTIRYKVFRDSGNKYVIDYQSPQELYIVMRSILLQHGNFRVNNSEFVSEIQNLNQMVVDWCAGEVLQNVELYAGEGGYLDRLTTLREPIDRPQYNDRPSNRTYDLSQFVGI